MNRLLYVGREDDGSDIVDVLVPNVYYRDDIGERWIQGDGDRRQAWGYLETWIEPAPGPGPSASRIEWGSQTGTGTQKEPRRLPAVMSDLEVTVDGRRLHANWTDDAPETRAAVADALPVEGEATRWGQELYFDCGVDVPAQDPVAEVPAGAVAYWPGGDAICLFWGPTPASDGDEPRAAAPVDVLAIVEDVGPLSDLDGGATVRLELA